MKSIKSRFGSRVYLALGILVIPLHSLADVPFVRGDVDASRSLSVADALSVLRHLFAKEPVTIDCLDAADVNDSGGLEITDGIFLLNYLFGHGVEPSAPFPGCGEDPTDDALSCEIFSRCGIDFYGLFLDGDGIFYVVDNSGSMLDSGELGIATREIIRNISSFPDDFQFGVEFFSSIVVKFPSTGAPAEATPENKAAAIAFIESIGGGSGSCPQVGIVGALQTANESTVRRRMVVYVGDGGGTCHGSNEADYLAQTLEVVTAQNTQGIVIHAVGVLLQSGTAQEAFLRELARRNGGSFINVSR